MGGEFFNAEAEASIIATFVAKRGAAAENAGALQVNDFHDAQLGQIFRAIQALVVERKEVDLVTLADALTRMYGSDALMSVVMAVMRDADVFSGSLRMKQHIEIVKAAAFRRELFSVIDIAKTQLMDATMDTGAILDGTRQKLREMQTTTRTWQSIGDVLIRAFETIEARSQGKEPFVTTGIRSLDRITAGFHKGELTVVGARPAVGKSALGGYMALSAARSGFKVGVVSREMTDVQYGMRILASGTVKVDPRDMRTGQVKDADWCELTDAMTMYGSYPVDFMFSTRTVEDLRLEVQNKIDRDGLDLLIVDYLQLMQTRRRFEKDYERIGYVSKALKDMTVDLNIAIVALAQVGRASEGQMPTLAELRGSGDIEQDADNVIFIHKPKDKSDRCVNPRDVAAFDGWAMQGYQYVALNAAKQRQGETGIAHVIFDPNRMRFMGIERSE